LSILPAWWKLLLTPWDQLRRKCPVLVLSRNLYSGARPWGSPPQHQQSKYGRECRVNTLDFGNRMTTARCIVSFIDFVICSNICTINLDTQTRRTYRDKKDMSAIKQLPQAVQVVSLQSRLRRCLVPDQHRAMASSPHP